MSYRLPPSALAGISATATPSNPSSGSETDDHLSDWASSLGAALRTKSLFDDLFFPTPEAALRHDEAKYGFGFKEVSERLGLDLYGRMKLVNWIRKEVRGSSGFMLIHKRPKPGEVEERCMAGGVLSGEEDLLVPVIEDDPLLRE